MINILCKNKKFFRFFGIFFITLFLIVPIKGVKVKTKTSKEKMEYRKRRKAATKFAKELKIKSALFFIEKNSRFGPEAISNLTKKMSEYETILDTFFSIIDPYTKNINMEKAIANQEIIFMLKEEIENIVREY